MYIEQDYKNAIKFALNFPLHDIPISYSYDEDKDVFRGNIFVAGDAWHSFKLQGGFIRSCLKWKGKREWCEKQWIIYREKKWIQ